MKNAEHVYTFVRGSLWTVFLAVILGILNYILRKTLSVYLPFNVYGFVYAVLSLAMLILAYLDLGFSQSATILMSRALAKQQKEEACGIYNWLFFIKLSLGLIIWGVLIITNSYWLNYFFHFNQFWIFFWLSSLIFIQSFCGTPIAAFSSLQKFATLSSLQLIVPIAFLILFYTSINFFNSSILSAILFPLSSFLAFIIAFRWVKKFGFTIKFSCLNKGKNVSKILHSSKWIAISGAGLTTMYYLDSLTLTYFKGTASVALYNIALPIMQIVQGLFLFLNVFIPISTELWHKGEKEKIAQVCRIVTTISIWSLWPILVFIILFGKYLIIFLFSSKYIAANPALIILFFGNVFYGLASFYIGVLNATDSIKQVAIVMIMGSLINLLLNIMLVPKFNLVGASLATVSSYIIITIVFFILLEKKLKEHMLIASYSIISCVAGVVTLCFIAIFDKHDFMTAIILFVVSMIIYAAVTFKVGVTLVKSSLILMFDRRKN